MDGSSRDKATRRVLPLAMALGLGCLAAREARAAEALDEVKTTVDQVLGILADPALKGPSRTTERRAKMRTVILERFGFDEMAKRALGVEWAARTPAERKEFVSLFTDLLERSYISRIEDYGGEKIVYQGQTVDGDHAEVHSDIIKGGERTQIVYRLLRHPGGWQVYDLVIDGVSLVNNYRVQFGQIIGQSGYAGLLKKLRAKQEALNEEDEPDESDDG